MNIKEKLDQLASVAGGRAWGASLGKPRVYLPSRKDISLYISFEDSAYSDHLDECSEVVGIWGEKINCYINDCGQSPAWYASQRRLAIDGARPAFYAVMWMNATDNEDEARRIAGGELGLSDEAVKHLINGRIDDARAALVPKLIHAE